VVRRVCLQPVPLVCRFGLDQAEETSMEHAEQAPMRTTYHKTFKEKLRPTPSQERALEAVLWRCRELYNAALEQRITAWQRRHISVSRFEQEAELKAIRAEFPEYAAIHSHILQDVLARLDNTYQAFFRRIQRREKAGFPRFKGMNRFHSFTFKEYGNGARLDNGVLVLSRIGRISVHWSRPIEGTPKTVMISKEADGWYVGDLVCGGTCSSPPIHWEGDGDRSGAGVVCHPGQRAADPHPSILS
jgi:Helix-turn-helix domain